MKFILGKVSNFNHLASFFIYYIFNLIKKSIIIYYNNVKNNKYHYIYVNFRFIKYYGFKRGD
ncbi:hypothetical protein CSC2_08770 [Clostridium zeae]|uniref:Uncharacterized protein n=1 Tax=Clostridium zeae TaxID=2759022 RepID=A0ABQ1E6M0_9CLOT|nr:hypothetical protein CSC2_08770 [Clostridium zeae]